MRLVTLWGQRASVADGTPELMVAWDEYSHDDWTEGFEAECKKAIESWEDDLIASRLILIEVSERQIRDAFDPAVVIAERHEVKGIPS